MIRGGDSGPGENSMASENLLPGSLPGAEGRGALARRLRYLGAAGPAHEGRRTERIGASSDSTRNYGSGASPRVPEALHGWERVGEFTWRRLVPGDNPIDPSELSELLLPNGYAPEDLLFFDIETTGLSGGAGSVVFLFGSARLEGRELLCEQLFLADFPGEPEFLQQLAKRIGRHRLFLSYNGRAFDAPLLKTRFVLNRMPFQLERQEDLLFWARRLWRRFLPDCSLGTVERGILGVERGEDVPGWEVPGIYLSYLMGGEAGRLSLVMEHNLQDVLSLTRIYGHVNRLLREEELPANTDGTTLGSYLLRTGHGRGEIILNDTFAGGDARAGRALSLHYKRLGRWGEAVALWEAMAREHSLFAAVELAKYHEHRLRNPRLALDWVNRIADWKLPLSEDQRRELTRRRIRLDRKCRAVGGREAAGEGMDSEGSQGVEGGTAKVENAPAKTGGAAAADPARKRFCDRLNALRELNRRRRLRDGSVVDPDARPRADGQ